MESLACAFFWRDEIGLSFARLRHKTTLAHSLARSLGWRRQLQLCAYCPGALEAMATGRDPIHTHLNIPQTSTLLTSRLLKYNSVQNISISCFKPLALLL